jgi:hypothetical protein
MTDAWVFDFPTCDFFDCSLGDARLFRDSGPSALSGPKALKNEGVHRLRHDAENIPTHGYTQPTYSDTAPLSCSAMGKKATKMIVTAAHIAARERLSENVVALIDEIYPLKRFKHKSDQQQTVAKAAGCSWSTIQRVILKSNATRLDTLVNLCTAFSISLANLMTPYFRTVKTGESGERPQRKPRSRKKKDVERPKFPTVEDREKRRADDSQGSVY